MNKKEEWLSLVNNVEKLFRMGHSPQTIADTLKIKLSLVLWIIHDNDRFS